MVFLSVVFGLVFLVSGAQLLVRGASCLARAIGLSPLVIGLTVVAYGTSAPELAVSLKANLAGRPDIALGNVVGSNIFNVLFILGVSALITPLVVARRLVRLDVPVMICVSVLAWLFSIDGTLGRMEGTLLFAGLVLYTVFLISQSRREQVVSRPEVTGVPRAHRNPILFSVLQILVGLVLLVVGARWLVEGATALARLLGASELVIALTVVAAGTSLPELATSIVASLRREPDIAVGNVVGSNIFNILAVLGASAAVSSPLNVASAALHFDIPVMTAVALVCLPIFFTGGRIARWEGALFLAYYAAYAVYLSLKGSQHEALPAFNTVMLLFALPATALGIGLSLRRSFRAKGNSRDGPER